MSESRLSALSSLSSSQTPLVRLEAGQQEGEGHVCTWQNDAERSLDLRHLRITCLDRLNNVMKQMEADKGKVRSNGAVCTL